jgi:hypothetical protein
MTVACTTVKSMLKRAASPRSLKHMPTSCPMKGLHFMELTDFGGLIRLAMASLGVSSAGVGVCGFD